MDGGEDGKDEKGESKDESKSEEKKDVKEFPREAYIGAPAAGAGKWGSCIRIFDPATGESTFIHELEENEAAFR